MQAPLEHEILLPVKAGFIAATLASACLLNVLQWGGAWRWLRPDFVALVLLYWGVHQPRRLGFGVAWLIGLLMDISDASLFGQHALGYTVLMYAAVVLHRRVLMLGLLSQVLQVAPLLLATDFIMLLIRLLMGAQFPGWGYFAPSLIGALLWAPVTVAFRLPQVPRPDPNSGVRVP